MASPMKVAYLVNQYPHVSHSFIRREIHAVEQTGIEILRISIRRSNSELVDPQDQAEQQLTRVLLGAGISSLIMALISTVVFNPIRFIRATLQAYRFGKQSGKMLRSIIYLIEACLLCSWLKAARMDHLHAHFGTNPTDVANLCHVLGGPPYSFTVHGPEEFDRPDAISLSQKIEDARFVVAVSSFGRSQLYRWCRYSDWHKIKVVHCGVDDSFLKGATTPLPDKPLIVCVGRLAEQKGQLLLLEAMAKLIQSGVECRLVLAGDGPMRDIIESERKSKQLTAHVRITGWLSNSVVLEEILKAKLVVLPSFAEGLPVVLMEALALGRPVVSTLIAGIPELVQDRVNGWLVPAGDVNSLAEAIKEGLATSLPRLTEMGQSGAQRVALLHDAKREGVELANSFLQVRL